MVPLNLSDIDIQAPDLSGTSDRVEPGLELPARRDVRQIEGEAPLLLVLTLPGQDSRAEYYGAKGAGDDNLGDSVELALVDSVLNQPKVNALGRRPPKLSRRNGMSKRPSARKISMSSPCFPVTMMKKV